MATSPNGYNHQLERTEMRRAAARARHERQMKMALFGGIVAVVVIVGTVFGLRVGRRKSANSPGSSPAMVVPRPVAVAPPNLASQSNDTVAAPGLAPPLPGAALKAPALPGGANLKTIRPQAGGQILARHVSAEVPVTYDERVLPLLSDAVLPPELRQPTAFWKLCNGFGGPPANDGATYAQISLGVRDPGVVMAGVARGIVATNPGASVKFIVREDTIPPIGTLRVALDGKHQRAAWIKKSASAAGSPYNWWKGGAASAPPIGTRPMVPAARTSAPMGNAIPVHHHGANVPAPAATPDLDLTLH